MIMITTAKPWWVVGSVHGCVTLYDVQAMQRHKALHCPALYRQASRELLKRVGVWGLKKSLPGWLQQGRGAAGAAG